MNPPAKKIPKIEFDTATYPAEQRFAVWAAAMPTHDISLPDGSATGHFSARADVWMLGDLLVSEVEFGPAHFIRPAEKIAADSVDQVAVYLIQEGHLEGEAAGRPVTAGSGSLVVFDQSLPAFTVHRNPIRCVTLTIARSAVAQVLPNWLDVHGLVLDTPMSRLLADHMLALARHLDSVTLDDAPALIKSTVRLLAAAIVAQHAAEKLVQPAARPAAVSQQVRRYIEENLGSADLTPERLCSVFGLSRPTLYRIFPSAEGVAGYIRKRRLELVHMRLSDIEEERSIASLAFAYGFTNAAHFSRLFKERYGYSPSAARQRLPNLPDAAEGEETAIYRQWVRHLR